MFHTVDPADTFAWDAVWTLVNGSGGFIASHYRPSQVPRESWCQNVSVKWYSTGSELAHAINGGLNASHGPARIMIDELRGGSIDMVEECAETMAAEYPHHRGRWGCYIVDGSRVSYTNLGGAIDSLLDAGAVLAPEFYPKQSEYMAAHPTNPGIRDQWLSDYFYGAGPRNYGRGFTKLNRLNWLMEWRRERGSDSRVVPLFGVTDAFLDGNRPAVFLDRMFYVFATRTGYAHLLSPGNGGVGSWKWQRPYMGNSSRDLAFAESWRHYCAFGHRASRLGIPT